MATPPPRFTGTVLDAPDPRLLARFYADLLGWRIVADEPEWVKLAAPEGGPALAFQAEPRYVPPAWPAAEGAPGMMMHLDFEVADLDTGAAHAESCGAVLADFQPQDDVRVLLDPAGHPFCLWVRT
ncbi:VOC family protein [Streptomyces physcomitrii]|uniref:VOC family protein n=1 Tax=Streptomyces physcomitrii TaxID=2724184 RepID=A0ABX1H380_9ACTN|nr:VOC family protein [Streptomyces physcomitrii]NKI42812.1 VOC family protein [Streptomyces physcomitrii]